MTEDEEAKVDVAGEQGGVYGNPERGTGWNLPRLVYGFG